MAEHGSDADRRKKDDPTEFVKHFIDLDLYDDFRVKHQIEEEFEAACSKYGKEEVVKNGTLPWTTDSTYRALVNDFRNKDWTKAVLTAANLGHYVADGHMPLHISSNYDGQLSGQAGLHRRFEETMIDQYIDQIVMKNSGIKKVDAVKSYIFNYLYANYSYTGLMLQADTRAFDQAGKRYNEDYYRFLWEKTGLFTSELIQKSSKILAELIYTAWLEAGKPAIPKNL